MSQEVTIDMLIQAGKDLGLELAKEKAESRRLRGELAMCQAELEERIQIMHGATLATIKDGKFEMTPAGMQEMLKKQRLMLEVVNEEVGRYRRLFAKLEDYFKASDNHCITFGWDDEEQDWLAFTELGVGREPMGEFHASADIPAVLEKAVGIVSDLQA